MDFICPLGQDKLQPIKVIAKEVIGRPYRIELELISNYQGIDSSNLFGQPASVTLYQNETRTFQGVITDFQQSDVKVNGRQIYTAVIEPWISLLAGDQHNKFFYDMSVPDVARSLMLGLNYDDCDIKQLSKKYFKKNSIAQYKENDLDFIHRILADDRIFYLFQQGKNSEIPYLRDMPVAVGNEAYPVTDMHPSKPYISAWDAQTQMIPQQIIINSYQHTHPHRDTKATQATTAQKSLTKGDWVYTETDVKTDDEALQKARHYSDAFASNAKKIHIESNIPSLTVGHSYLISHQDDNDKNGRYVVLEVTHTAIDHRYIDASQGVQYSNTAIVQSDNQPVTPQLIAPQDIDAAQSAIVITPTGQNMYTNKFAAVKTQMSWQQSDNIDIKNLPWARASQWQSGMRWGTQFIPRINDEVLVDFFQGNPQRPVVVGNAYNANSNPAYQAQSYPGLTSINTQINNTQTGHQLNFDDKPNMESLRLLSQGTYQENIKNDASLTVGGQESLSVNGQYKTQVSSGQSAFTANKAILQVGSNEIIMDASGIQINGSKVTLKASGVGGGYPVARLGDNHSCNATTALIPHTGGAINSGSSLLLVNNLPAARLNDTASCLPETDTISEGVSNIQIKGIPLARVAHQTKHGGKITTGSGNVYVDDAGFTSSLMSSILNPTSGNTDIGQHWIQGHYPDQAGMSWRIVHQSGLAYQGVLDQDGKTEKITNLPNGTADIYFGDRPQLEDKLTQQRETLKTHLDNIIATLKTMPRPAQDLLAAAKSTDLTWYKSKEDKAEAYTELAKSFGTGAVIGLRQSVVGLFENSSLAFYGDTRLMQIAAIQHNYALFEKEKQQEETDLTSMKGEIDKALALIKLVCTDSETRQILYQFFEEYYHTAPLIVISKQAGEVIGNLSMCVFTAIVLKSVSLEPIELAGQMTSDIGTASDELSNIAETIDDLNKLRVIQAADVDRVHKIETPEYESAQATLDAYQRLDNDKEAKERSTLAKINVIKNGCKEILKYTDAELLALATKGVAPVDGYLARIVGLPANIPMDLERGLVANSNLTWVTTFEQIESAGLDPRLITAKLGMPYNPAYNYHLLLFKDIATMTSDANIPTKLFIPTFGNLTTIAQRDARVIKAFNATGVPIDILPDVMNSEYREEYDTLMQEMMAQLGDGIKDNGTVREYIFAKTTNHNMAMARYIIENSYGASKEFLGDGTTRYMGEGRSRGALEYMLYDNTGVTLQQLQNRGQLSILPCTPITQCPIVGAQ